LHSQNIEVYDAHLSKLQKSIPAWKAEIDAIDPAQITVPYHIGKLIEDDKKTLLQNLDIAYSYLGMIRAQHQLSQEINLYASLRDVRANMDDLSDVLIYLISSDQKAAQSWADHLGPISRSSN
jgi:hypothetical protein